MAKGELTQNLAAEDLLAEAARWRDQGHKVALATVVKTWGSSPRPVGSQLIVDDRLRLQGSVSGGCIEGAVVHEAQARSEEHTSELPALMRISYSVFCLKTTPTS